MLCLSGFELYSRWVPLGHAFYFEDLRATSKIYEPKSQSSSPRRTGIDV